MSNPWRNSPLVGNPGWAMGYSDDMDCCPDRLMMISLPPKQDCGVVESSFWRKITLMQCLSSLGDSCSRLKKCLVSLSVLISLWSKALTHVLSPEQLLNPKYLLLSHSRSPPPMGNSVHWGWYGALRMMFLISQHPLLKSWAYKHPQQQCWSWGHWWHSWPCTSCSKSSNGSTFFKVQFAKCYPHTWLVCIQ